MTLTTDSPEGPRDFFSGKLINPLGTASSQDGADTSNSADECPKSDSQKDDIICTQLD